MKNKYRNFMILSAIFMLTVVFILEKLPKTIYGAEVKKQPSIIVSEIKQNEDGNLRLKIGLRNFSFKKKMNLLFYLENTSKKEGFSEIYRERIKGREELRLNIPLKLKGSDFYRWKIEVIEGKKKATWMAEKPIYLKGEFEKDRFLKPSLHFEDDDLVIRWEEEKRGDFWVGIYHEDSPDLFMEKIVRENEAKLFIPSEMKRFKVALAYYLDGNKSNFSLFDVPDRDLPNVRVSFQGLSKEKKSKYDLDLIYTGDCSTTIEVNEMPFYKEVKEQGRFTLKLPEGEANIKVTVVSENGNVRTFQDEIFVDTIFPKINLDNGLDGAVTGDSSIDISGSCDEMVELTLNGKKVDLDEENRFFSNMELKEGENEIKLVAKDRGGNISNLRAVVKRQIKHEADIRIVILIYGSFGLIFLAYVITFIRWLRVRKKRKS